MPDECSVRFFASETSGRIDEQIAERFMVLGTLFERNGLAAGPINDVFISSRRFAAALTATYTVHVAA